MRPEFQVHVLNESGLAAASQIAEAFDQLLAQLETIVGHTQSREFALTRTHAETACFYAKKAMANVSINQLDPTPPVEGLN